MTAKYVCLPCGKPCSGDEARKIATQIDAIVEGKAGVRELVVEAFVDQLPAHCMPKPQNLIDGRTIVTCITCFGEFLRAANAEVKALEDEIDDASLKMERCFDSESSSDC